MHQHLIRLFPRFLAAALLAMPAAALAAGFAVVGTEGATSAETAEGSRPLRVADAVEPGMSVFTGRGRAELHLEPAGAIALGDDSRVFLHSIEPVSPPARMHLVRLVVESGSMRASTRASSTPIPADLRINLGALRLRVFGAEVWMERARDHDEVCVIEGAVELQTPAGPQRLDEPGSCLRLLASGVQHLDAQAAAPITPRLQRTALAAVGGVVAPDPVSAPAAAIAAPVPTQDAVAMAPAAPIAAADTPAAATAVTATAGAASPAQIAAGSPTDAAWTIVLASLPDAEVARREAERLRSTGLDTEVIGSTRSDGTATWRIVTGRYADKAAAAEDISAIRKRRGFAKAWVAQLP